MAGTLRVNGKEHDLGKHEYLGVVETINIGRPGDPQSGTATVTIDDIARKARVLPTARNAKVGDTVIVEKTGKVYRITAKATYEPPPQVSGSMGNPPANATTVSGSNIPSLPLPPAPPYSSVGTTLEWVVEFCNNVRTHLISLETWNMSNRARTNDATSGVNTLRTTVNTNASRTNQVRDYASNAGDLVEPVVGVLKDEGLARD